MGSKWKLGKQQKETTKKPHRQKKKIKPTIGKGDKGNETVKDLKIKVRSQDK